MNKVFLTMCAMVAVSLQLTAASVDVTTAHAAAARFIAGQQAAKHLSSSTVSVAPRLVCAEAVKPGASETAYYIFNTTDSYVIIAGDDRAHQVLACGDAPIDMDNVPIAMRYWLDCYREDMEYLAAHPEFKPAPAVPAVGVSVSPLLTAMWSQESPYYNHCPMSGGAHCLTGCAATSLAMIFYYWKYPMGLTPSIPSFTTRSLGLYVEQLEPTTFDWDNMRDRYNGGYSAEQADAMAWLMRYVGQAEQMDYTPSSSGTYGPNIIHAVRVFGFDDGARYIYKSRYNDDEWAHLIQEELEQRRPIEFCAYGGMSGHAFNVDGYDSQNDLYHVNWGWGGSANGYFALNGFRGGGVTYRTEQQMVIGMEPPATKPTIRPEWHRMAMSSYIDKTATATLAIKGALLTGDVTLTLNDPSGAFALPQNTISVTRITNDRNTTASLSVSYTPQNEGTDNATITLCSPGAQDVTVHLSGNGVLETYNPVMTQASDVTPSSFVANWADPTPQHNVAGYNLEVSRVPYSDSRMRQDFHALTAGGSLADCSSQLDEITNVAGWTGSKLYRGDSYLRLGSSGYKGQLTTPSIDMDGNEGHVTVKISAKSAAASSQALLRIGCDGHDTTFIVTNEQQSHVVLLPCTVDAPATVTFSTPVKGHLVLLYDIEVMAGDDYSGIDPTTTRTFERIGETSFKVDAVTPGFYSMRVQAIYSNGTLSPWSVPMRVAVDWANGDVNHDGEINLADANAIVNVLLGHTTDRRTITASDVNGDGEVNLGDVNAIINKVLQQ